MADRTFKLFVVNKHRRYKNNKVVLSRHYYEVDDVAKAILEAYRLAEEESEDFLVVQVLAEASKPKK